MPTDKSAYFHHRSAAIDETKHGGDLMKSLVWSILALAEAIVVAAEIVSEKP